ncbi:HD domain-containing protein [Mycolicibacillus trivialis]
MSAATPRLTDRFDRALQYTAEVHRHQTRKAGDIPYLGHLLSVAGLVIGAGGSEDQAIAALLHDAAEDQGGADTLAEIEELFGARVAGIVGECSDTFETPKPPWRPRKERYIDLLGGVSDDALLVSMADKLDNARALLRDHRAVGDAVWQRFNQHHPAAHLWYYRALLEVYTRRSDSALVTELREVIETLATEIGPAGLEEWRT